MTRWRWLIGAASGLRRLRSETEIERVFRDAQMSRAGGTEKKSTQISKMLEQAWLAGRLSPEDVRNFEAPVSEIDPSSPASNSHR